MSRARADIEDDDPITLETASKVVLCGAVTVSTLRAEIKRGNLGALRIGKNLFTTPADIREMKNRCRVQLSRQSGQSQDRKKLIAAGDMSTPTTTRFS